MLSTSRRKSSTTLWTAARDPSRCSVDRARLAALEDPREALIISRRPGGILGVDFLLWQPYRGSTFPAIISKIEAKISPFGETLQLAWGNYPMAFCGHFGHLHRAG